MARFSRGSFPARGRTTRRETNWDVGVGGTVQDNVASTAAIFLGQAITPSVPGLTVIRIRGQLLIYLSAAAVANDGFEGAIGIGVASLAAVTAGIGSVPTPRIEASSDNWLWHSFFSVHSGGIIDTMGADNDMQINSGSAVIRMEIDSKAMRKFDQAQSIYAAIDVVEQGTAVARISLDTRTLVKLS